MNIFNTIFKLPLNAFFAHVGVMIIRFNFKSIDLCLTRQDVCLSRTILFF